MTAPAPGPTAGPGTATTAPLPTRRRLLAVALSGAALVTVAGCGLDPHSIRWDDDSPVPSRTPDADEIARRRAVQTSRDLRAACDATTAATPAQVQVLQEVAQQHVQHLEALGATAATPSAAPSTTAPPTTAPAATGSATTAPAPPAPAPGPALVAAHDAGQRQATADAATVSGALARLLALVAAARAVQAHRLAGALGAQPPATTPPLPLAPAPEGAGTATPGSTGPGSVATTGADRTDGTPSLRDAERTALEALREGELAAVYGYGVLAARLTGPERTRALAALAEHAASAREVADVLERADVEPPAGAPAYELPAPVGTPAEARAVAAGMESALVALAADLAAVTDGRLRAPAVDLTVRRALAAARWGAAPAAFPGAG